MTGAVSALQQHPWAGIGVMLGSFLLVLAGLQLYARATAASPEATRKMLHVGAGALTLALPVLFERTWPVLLLAGASAALLAAVRFSPLLRALLGDVAHRVERTTFGELYFPVSVALVFWLTRGESPLLFVIPILMVTLADATGAIIGARYGLTPYVGASKSVEGSVAFVTVAFLCVHIPLLLWSDVGRAESLLIAWTVALLVMLLEGSAWRGLDNLFIPVGGYFLLRALIPLGADALLPRLLATAVLVLLVVLARRRMTLEDNSLVAGAFLCYVVWAAMGWRWLIGPLAIAVGYRWLSPPTPENTRRMHGIGAVLAVWAPAIAWLALARAMGEPAVLFPYTMGFGAHLAMFGISRLAFQFPGAPMTRLLPRAVVTSWAIVTVPLAAVPDVHLPGLAAPVASIGAIALGAGIFVAAQADIRHVPHTARRWTYQAGAAGVASAAAWAIAGVVSRVAG